MHIDSHAVVLGPAHLGRHDHKRILRDQVANTPLLVERREVELEGVGSPHEEQ